MLGLASIYLRREREAHGVRTVLMEHNDRFSRMSIRRYGSLYDKTLI